VMPRVWSTSGKGREEMGADEEEVNEVEPKWNGSGSNYGSRVFANENTSRKKKKKIHSLS